MFTPKNKHRKLVPASLLSIYIFAVLVGILGVTIRPAFAAVPTQASAMKAACLSFGVNKPNGAGGTENLSASDLHIREETCQTGFGAALAPKAKAPPAKPNATNVLSNPCYATIFKNDLPKAFICFEGYQIGWSQRAATLKLPATAADVSPAAAKADAAKTAASTKGQEDCESSGGPLSWMLCKIIDGLASAVDGIYKEIIQPLLATKPIDITNSSGDPTNTFAIWSNFRIYGNIFLVIALLVVVFGESIGGGLIDAYAAKKILPRLVVATILINLSIYIVAFAVDITNILGNGLEALIEEPFKGASAFQLKIGGTLGNIGFTGLVAGGIWAFSPIVIEFLLVFVLIPTFFIFIAILVTILLRQALIIFLVLSAPIAFALYCLPNTEKYFRKWVELLFQTLLIYPIIAVIFALANITSVTIGKTGTGAIGPIGQLLSVVALVAPLYLIPYSFKLAGGLLGRAHDLTKSAAKRGEEMTKGNGNDPDSWRNRSRLKMGMRNTEHGLTGKAMSARLQNPTGVFTKKGRAIRKGNQEAIREAGRAKFGQKFAESDMVQKANTKNDQYQLALADEGMAQKKLAAASSPTEKAAWQQAIASARMTPKSPATRLIAANAVAQSGFHYADGQQGYNELAETMSNITGAKLTRDTSGNVTGATGASAGVFANAMNQSQYNFRTAGRFDLGGINNGTGWDYDAGMGKASGYTAGQAKKETFVAGASAKLGSNTTVAGKTLDQEQLAKSIGENLRSGTANAKDVASWHATLLDAQAGPTGLNKAEIDKQMSAIEDTIRRASPDDTSAKDLAALVAENRQKMLLRRMPDPSERDKQ